MFVCMYISVRFGPSRCICDPDITALTVPSDQHMRIILASDGVWDVLTEDAVISAAIRSKSSVRTAKAIAHEAFHIRATGSLRLDDITVIVVDVNPEQFRSGGTVLTCEVGNCVIT